jgi:RND family efflux transporter MFP subunit
MHTRRILLAAPLALLGACSNPADSAPRPSERVADVRILAVQPRPLEVEITAVGTLEPENRVVVAAQEPGLVTALAVREGDLVRPGALLARLDDREVAAQLAEAEARLTEATSNHQRAQALEAAGLLPAAEGDAARAALQVARARVEALRARVSFTRVTAPVAGVVTVRHVEVGDTVAARTPLLELASGRLVLRVPISELDVVKLAEGDRARVQVDALPGSTVTARVLRIFPAADPTTRQVTVELVLENPPPAMRPGFLARAQLVVERLPDALMVPEHAVLRGSEIPTFLWVVEGDTAKVQPVEVGLRQGGEARILSGLAPGDQVVVEGTAALVEGGKVRRREGEGA